MPHDLQFESENGVNVMFRCLNCGEPIGFNKPGIGTPCPERIEGLWVAPIDADLYMGPCE